MKVYTDLYLKKLQDMVNAGRMTEQEQAKLIIYYLYKKNNK